MTKNALNYLQLADFTVLLLFYLKCDKTAGGGFQVLFTLHITKNGGNSESVRDIWKRFSPILIQFCVAQLSSWRQQWCCQLLAIFSLICTG